jgi:hypothetical protein
MKYIAGLDIRSLIPPTFQPESEYERQLLSHNRSYYDRMRVYREEIIKTCQAFAGQSPLITGTLLWERKRIKNLADEVHKRYSICLITSARVIEVDRDNLSAALSSV